MRRESSVTMVTQWRPLLPSIVQLLMLLVVCRADVVTGQEKSDIRHDHHMDANKATRNVRQMSGKAPLPMNAAVLSTNSAPTNDRLWATVGNGHLATAVHSNTVFMNGLYNGHTTTSHRARIPSFTAVNINHISLPYTEKKYSLDMNKGMYLERYTGNGWYVEMKVYAHRTLTRLLVTELTMSSMTRKTVPISVTLSVNKGPPSDDLHLQTGQSDVHNANFVYGSSVSREIPTSKQVPVCIYYSNIPSVVSFTAGANTTSSHIYLASISPFKEQAKEYFENGMNKFGNNTLEQEHVAAWVDLWGRGRLDIEGNTDLASATYSALYYILSSMPTQEEKTWPFIGLSPEGLAHGKQGYHGHVFWDQATWMYPTILSLHADLGKTIVDTRIRTLDSAYLYAKQRGYQGAMYPWESAYTGLNVCPGLIWAKYEQHISGDIALAFKQYLMMTHDSDVIQLDRFGEAINKIAEFWQSRVSLNNQSGLYEIWNVMPPDEAHYPVNNSAYTNQIARISLQLPTFAQQFGGSTPPKVFAEIASKIYIPFDKNGQFHPEFSNFKSSSTVKQADVVLLGYPLMMEMTTDVRKNDLTLYERLTPGGPAMTWGMFAIGWLELGEPGRAQPLFLRQLKNKRAPFNIWTENADGSGVVNFITGMGGYLQSVLFGYSGLRICENHLDLNPTPVPSTSALNITGLDYLGSSLHVRCTASDTTITLTRAGKTTLYVYVYSTKAVTRLAAGTAVSTPREKIAITARAGSGAITPTSCFTK